METRTGRVVFTTRPLRRAARICVRASIPFSTRRLWAAGSLFYGAASFTYSLFQAARCFRRHGIGVHLWEPLCLIEVFYFFFSRRSLLRQLAPIRKKRGRRLSAKKRRRSSVYFAAVFKIPAATRRSAPRSLVSVCLSFIRARRRQSQASDRCKQNRRRRAPRINRAFRSQGADARLRS